MRFLLFTDPHISSKAEFSKPTEDGFTDYLHRVIDSFGWIQSLVKDEKPDFVAMLGDLFDTTGFVDTVSLHVGSMVCESLTTVCEHFSIPLYWLVGNHDIYSEQSHNLKFLNLTSWGTVVNETQGSAYVNDYPVLLLPWGGEVPKTWDYPIVLSHKEIKGGVLNAKKRSEQGLDPNAGPWIFNGHYHLPDQVGKCCQVGSLLSRGFNDGPSLARGAVLVDYDGEDCRVERLPNPHEIPYRTVSILTPTDATRWQARLQQGLTGLENSYVRVVYDDMYKETAEQLTKRSQGSRLELRVKESEQTYEVVSEVFSPEENFKQYVDNVLVFDMVVESSERELCLEKGYAYIESVKKDLQTTTKPIRFKQLQATGFQSIREIDVDLDNQGLVWVGGVNGVGKTTLLEALFWVLTGKSLRFGDRVGDDVIGWHTDTCSVTAAVEIGGQDYVIFRSRKPNNVGLYLNGEDISARRAKDTEKKIQELIGRSKDVLQHSIFLTSDLETRFTALSYPDRIRLLESITDAGIYSKIEARVKEDYRSICSDINRLKGSIQTIESSLQAKRKRLQQVTGELVEAMRDQEDKLTSLKSELSAEITKRDRLESRIESLKEKRKTLAFKIPLMSSGVDLAVSRKRGIKSTVDKLRWELQKVEREADSNHKMISKGQCPICLSTDLKSTLSGRMKDLKEEATHLESRIALFKNKLDDFEQLEIKKREALTAVQKARDTADVAHRQLESDYQKHESRIIKIKAEMDVSKVSVARLEGFRDEIKASIAQDETTLKDVTEKRTELGVEEHVVGFLAHAFSTNGIRAQMLSSVTVPFLNKRVQNYSDVLNMPFTLTTRVESKTGTEDNKVDILIPGQRTYKACSRGEKRRVDLAVQCALNDLAIATGGSKVNLLVADEVIDPLDEQGVQAFIEVLQTKAKDSTVVLITHKPFLDSYAAKRWLLTKQDGITQIQVN